jgi:hypothetical protein
LNISNLKIDQQLIQVGRLSKELAKFSEKEKHYEDYRIRTIENIIDGVVYLDGYLNDHQSYEKSANPKNLHTYSSNTGKNLFEDKNTDWELYLIKDVLINNDGAIITTTANNTNNQLILDKNDFCETLKEIADSLDDVENSLTKILNNLPNNPSPLKTQDTFKLVKHSDEENKTAKQKMIVLKNKAFYKTEKKEISDMQAKMNSITNNMSPRERENLRDVMDWCEKENTSITKYLTEHERSKL